MRKVLVLLCLILVTVQLLGVIVAMAAAEWPGVDETVVEKFAEQAGRPASEPFINTDQGDLLLFCFLVAGTAGGFVMGYSCRALFPPVEKTREVYGECPK